MLQQLLYLLYISGTCLIWGTPLVLLTRKNTEPPKRLTAEEILLSFFCGLIIISLVAAWVSLFFPLRFFILPSLTLILLTLEVILLLSKRTLQFQPACLLRKSNAVYLVAFIVIFLLLITLASNRPVMEDMDLYHLQIIRWNQEYGTVPGVANLYLRYGFYSNWLYSIAFFALPFKQDNFLYLNLAICAWFCFFLIYKIQFHLKQEGNNGHAELSVLYFLILIFCLIEWKLLRGSSSSTSYDFPVTVFTIVVLMLITENILVGPSRDATRLLSALTIAAGTAFLKISGAPILLIMLVYLIVTRELLKTYVWFFICIALFLVPFLAKNYIQSGYPVFPFTYFSIFHPDWQVPKSMMEQHAHYISLYNKYLNTLVTESMWLSPPSNKWMAGWLNRQTIFDYILVILVLLSLPASILALWKKWISRNLFVIYATSFSGLLAWFLSSPDPRFAYGLLLFTGFLISAFFVKWLLRSIVIKVLLGAILLPILIYGSMKFHPENVLRPAAVLNPDSKEVIINHSIYHIPEVIKGNWNSRCYYQNLPCIYQVNPYLEQRTTSLKDGFRMKPVTDSSFILNYRY